MSVGLSINLGSAGGADVRIGLDWRDAKRLHVSPKYGPMRLVFGFAVVFFFAGAGIGEYLRGRANLAGAIVAGLLALIGVAILFARSTVTLDRRRGVALSRWGVPFTVRSTSVPLSRLQAVKIAKESIGRQDSPSTIYEVSLSGKGAPIVALGSAGTWEAAVELAEAFAKFLEIGVDDRVIGESRPYAALDRPISESPRAALRAWPFRRELPWQIRPQVDDLPGGGIAVHVPRPWRMMFGACGVMGLLTLLFFTLPGLVLDRYTAGRFTWSALFAILPIGVIVATGVKLGLGYSSDVKASPGRLVVRTRGLVVRRRVEIPAAELEALHVMGGELGGPQGAVALLMDGFIVARSDRASVRFGHGLTQADLEDLAARLRAIVASSQARVAGVRAPVLTHMLVPSQWPFALVCAGALGLLARADARHLLTTRASPSGWDYWLVLVGFACAVAAVGGVVLSVLLRLFDSVRRRQAG